MTPIVTNLLRSNNQGLIGIAQSLDSTNPPLVIDLPAPSTATAPNLRSSLNTGNELHRSITKVIRDRAPLPGYSTFSDLLLPWLRDSGAHKIRASVELDHPAVRGICDIFVSGGFNSYGIVEIKGRGDYLPDFPSLKHRLQLALYTHAASRLYGLDSFWCALAYCSLGSGSLRLFVWPHIDFQSSEMDEALRYAA